MNVFNILAVFGFGVVLWDLRCDAATIVVKLCGRQLGNAMSKICRVHNSPSWDVPTVVEQPAAIVRRRRRTGIADECCAYGCTYEQLSSYCAISAKLEIPPIESHTIEDRSAEGGELVRQVADVSKDAVAVAAEREVGRRSRGYGRGPLGRCWCRKRRSGKRRSTLMGNMELVRNAARAAPVLGTVSPLLTWGRTLNTDLPSLERNRYAYIAVYS